MPRLALGVLFVVASIGCATSLEDAHVASPATESAALPSNMSKTARCRALSDREALWSSLGTGSTLLAGAGGVASIPVEDRYRTWTLGASIVAAAFASFGQLYGHRLAESWVRECRKKSAK